jgi:hypothetical protein
MNINEFVQRVILDALESGEYSPDDIRENVTVALDRHEARIADAEDYWPNRELGWPKSPEPEIQTASNGAGATMPQSRRRSEPLHGDDLARPGDEPDLPMPGDRW